MNAKLPPLLETSINTLTSEGGWILGEQLVSSAFGDLAITLRRDNVRMRIVRDRGQWYIEFSESGWASEWYDLALIQEVLTGSIGEDVLSLEQQVRIVSSNWPKIVELFRPERAKCTHTLLSQLRLERSKRRMPELFK